jgi:hypothetical protein
MGTGYNKHVTVNLNIYIFHHQHHPWSMFCIEKPLVAQPLKKLSALYGTGKFITLLKIARQWSVS